MSLDEAAARLAAERARARLTATFGELQDRLHPGTIAQNAWEGAVDRSTELAEDAAEFARKRPGVAAAAVAGVVALFAGRPLARKLRAKPKTGPKSGKVYPTAKAPRLAAPPFDQESSS